MTNSLSSLYILVGPPKTGTTSLQVALESKARQDPSSIRYHGAFQPRSRNNGSLAWRLHNAFFSGSRIAELVTIKQELNNLLMASNVPVVISEEMFLVSQSKLGWTKKLEYLSLVVEPSMTTIVIALREPGAALRSYYREIFESLPLIYRLSFRAWCFCDQARVFNYNAIAEAASGLGFKLQFFDMNLLGAGKVGVDAILGGNKEFAGSILDVGRENVDPNRKDCDSQSRHLPGIVLCFSSFKRMLALLNCQALSPWLRRIDGFAITVRQPGSRKLVVPRNLLNAFYNSYRQRLVA